jgi:hypothetical protein
MLIIVAEVRSWPTLLLESFRAPGVNDVRCESKLRSRAPCQSNKMQIIFFDRVDVFNYRYIIIGGAMLLFIESSRQHNFSRDDRHKPPRWTVYICDGCGSLPGGVLLVVARNYIEFGVDSNMHGYDAVRKSYSIKRRDMRGNTIVIIILTGRTSTSRVVTSRDTASFPDTDRIRGSRRPPQQQIRRASM